MKHIFTHEMKNSVTLIVVMSVIMTLTGFYFNVHYGLVCLIVCTVFCMITIYILFQRHKKILRMSVEIDKILHGEEKLLFTDYSEGELSVLGDEIRKLTLRLLEQTEALTRDKIYLADSIADISHQIRTPLTSINLILTFLTDMEAQEIEAPSENAARRQKLFSELRELLTRIDWLVDALLKISRLDTGTVSIKKEPVSVRELTGRITQLLEIPIELRGLELVLDIPDNCSFEGDLSWSVEALANIVKNCMEHTPAGGKITINAQQNPLFTQIVVSDTGSGIAPEDIDHIFERFYKGKDSSVQSIGIGLALARMIISRHNGTIQAQNCEDGGARFIIKIYSGVH